jgi:hypothetical protein
MQIFEVTQRFGRRYRESNLILNFLLSDLHLGTRIHSNVLQNKPVLFRPFFLEAIRAVPATAAATVAPGNEIEFSKYAIVIFFVVVHAFNQVSAPAREGILFFKSDKLIEFLQTIRAEAVKKCVGEKRFGFIAQCETGTGACRYIFGMANEFLFTSRTYFLFSSGHY